MALGHGGVRVRRRPPTMRSWGAKAACLACLAAGSVSCREWRNQRLKDIPIQSAVFTRPTGELELAYDHRTSVDRSSDEEAEREFQVSNTAWKESIHLATQGFIYHPYLLELGLGGTFGLRQFETTETSTGLADTDTEGSQRATGMLTDFDLSGLALQRKDYPFSFHARRQTDLLPRQFAGSIEQETTRLGAEQRLRWGISETELTLDRLQTRQSETQSLDVGTPSLDVVETSFGWHTRLNLAKRETLDWRLSHSTTQRQQESGAFDAGGLSEGLTVGAGETESDEQTEALVEHRWDFGARRQLHLDSYLRGLEQRGARVYKQLDWRERFAADHTPKFSPKFSTFYTWSFQDFRQGVGDEQAMVAGGAAQQVTPQDQEQQQQLGRLGAGFSHQLYGSLRTNGDAYASQRTFSEGAVEDELNARIYWVYRKRNPLGHLNAALGLRTVRRSETGSQTVATVIDEPVTLTGTTPQRLAHPRVVVGTVVVTDGTGLITYAEGADYRLRQQGNFTEIERVLGGAIPDPGPVLVDYQYEIGGDIETDTLGWLAGVRQDFNFGLSVYYRHESQTQTIGGQQGDEGTELVPDNIETDILGTEYRYKGLLLRAEAEDRRATVSPLKATRLRAEYRIEPWRYLALHAGAGYTINRFPQEDDRDQDVAADGTDAAERREDVLTLDGGLNFRALRDLTVDLSLAYTQEEDNLRGITEGVSMRARAEYRFRLWSVQVGLEHTELLQSFSSDRSDDRLFFTIKRSF